jgi:hypothetical protein
MAGAYTLIADGHAFSWQRSPSCGDNSLRRGKRHSRSSPSCSTCKTIFARQPTKRNGSMGVSGIAIVLDDF